jgi:hypothetical protein
LRERAGYPTGFYWGGFDLPSDGCWEVTAAAGASELTFVADVRHSIQRFVQLPDTRVTWSKEIGRITDGRTELVVTSIELENPQTRTRRLRGTRIDVTDGVVSDQLWQEEVQSATMRRKIGDWAAGNLNVFALHFGYAINNATGFSIDIEKPRYQFRGAEKSAELARLLLQALDDLKALPR